MTSSSLVKIMIGVLSGLGGFVVGALSRQPEINNLKKQIKKLQKENKRLQTLMQNQSEQIRNLIVKYKALKVYQFSKRYESRSSIRGLLVYQYGLRDYLELLIRTAKSEREMSKEDVLFYNMFDKIIEGKSISNNEKEAIKEYVNHKHMWDIMRMKECNTSELYEEIQNFDLKSLVIN